MKGFESIKQITSTKGKILMMSAFVTMLSFLASNEKLSAQSDSIRIYTEKRFLIQRGEVENTFNNLNNDFTETQKMFESGEGKMVSPNQTMYLEKEGSGYFFVHPQTGEKFIASFTVDEQNSGILILDLKDEKGSFLFSKSFTLPKTQELVDLLEGFDKSDTSFEAFRALGFNFIFKSNPKEGVSYRGVEAIILDQDQNRAYLGGMGLK